MSVSTKTRVTLYGFETDTDVRWYATRFDRDCAAVIYVNGRPPSAGVVKRITDRVQPTNWRVRAIEATGVAVLATVVPTDDGGGN